MKNYLHFFLCFLAINCFAQNVEIPDAIFKSYLLSNPDINDNNDDEIQLTEANNYGALIDIRGLGITDLTGLENFTNLYSLSAQDNMLTSINLSQNARLHSLGIDNNQITTLDLSNNPLLETIRCNQNLLIELDISTNLNLDYIECGSNLLTTLDVTPHTKLEVLFCNNNAIKEIDVTNCPELYILNCSVNDKIPSIDVSQNLKLTRLECSSNLVTTLDLSKNPLLENLDCHGNQISSLDLSDKPALTYLRCSNNMLTSLNLSNAVELSSIYSFDNLLTELSVEDSPKITRLSCGDNQIEYLDLSKNPILDNLDCHENNLHYLNIANGNNENLGTMKAFYNAALNCIIVDEDLDLDNLPELWSKDPGAEYNGSCCSATSFETTETICNGEAYTSPSGEVFTTAGTYNYMLTNVGGCDSLVTLSLEVFTVDLAVTQDGNIFNATASDATFQWVNCDDNVAINGANDSTFSPDVNGSYAVLVGQEGCLELSACFDIMAVGTYDFIKSNLKIFPNPTHGDLRIDLGETYEEVVITISTSTGQLLSRTAYHTLHLLDIELAHSGVYFIEIQTDRGRLTNTKVIKF